MGVAPLFDGYNLNNTELFARQPLDLALNSRICYNTLVEDNYVSPNGNVHNYYQVIQDFSGIILDRNS